MQTTPRRIGLTIVVCTTLLFAVTAAQGGVTPEHQCQATKNNTAGKYAACRQNAEAKLAARGDTSKYSDALDKCETKFSAAWSAAEAKAAKAGVTCPDAPVGASAFEGAIAAHTGTIATALAGGGLAICGNGVVDGGEDCDLKPGGVGGATCFSQGHGSGNLDCAANCVFDYSGCVHIVFITNGAYGADLGGLAGADARCQAAATAAGVAGTYKAWLSDSASNAATRLAHAASSYALLDGTVIANDWAAFASTSHQNPIDVSESGAAVSNAEVWTGSGGSGIGTGGCSGWTSTDPGGSFPAVGLSSSAGSGWSNVYLQTCDRSAHLYCVQQ